MDLAETLVARDIGLVFGGSGLGLMGVVADEILRRGGAVTGVIPEALMGKEVPHRGLEDLRVVGSMHERKALMADLSDGFVALPGGFGTLEEFAEVLTWTQLGIQAKPCGLLDVAGYWNQILGFFDHAVAEGFVKPVNRSLVLASDLAAGLVDRLAAWEPPAALRPEPVRAAGDEGRATNGAGETGETGETSDDGSGRPRICPAAVLVAQIPEPPRPGGAVALRSASGPAPRLD